MPPPTKVLQLIERFERNLSEYNHPDHKEARARAEFIGPLLQALGWDGRSEIVAGSCGWGEIVGLRRSVARWELRSIIGLGKYT